jgi:hypothetical protein
VGVFPAYVVPPIRVATDLREGRATGGVVPLVGLVDLSASELASLRSSDRFLSSSDTGGPMA